MREMEIRRFEDYFTDFARTTRTAKSMKEIREVQKELRGLLKGTYGTLNDILSIPGKDIVSREILADYEKFHSKLGRYLDKIFWL